MPLTLGVAFPVVGKLRQALKALGDALGVQEALHERAVKRMKARHAGQKKAERQAKAAGDAADRLRAEATLYLTFTSVEFDQPRGERKLRKAERKGNKANTLNAKAVKERERAIIWKGRVRKIAKRIAGIETDVEKIREEIKELGPTVNVAKSEVTGGTFPQRWRASNLKSVECCATGRRRNAYSQSGVADIHHPYGPGPSSSSRDDCSSFGRSHCLATGADDPSGHDFSPEGYTGDGAEAHGRWVQVTLDEMIAAGHGYIIYGSGTGHHWEDYCPSETDKMRTVGHGSAPVDFGTVHLFGAGEVERYYVFKPHGKDTL